MQRARPTDDEIEAVQRRIEAEVRAKIIEDLAAGKVPRPVGCRLVVAKAHAFGRTHLRYEPIVSPPHHSLSCEASDCTGGTVDISEDVAQFIESVKSGGEPIQQYVGGCRKVIVFSAKTPKRFTPQNHKVCRMQTPFALIWLDSFAP